MREIYIRRVNLSRVIPAAVCADDVRTRVNKNSIYSIYGIVFEKVAISANLSRILVSRKLSPPTTSLRPKEKGSNAGVLGNIAKQLDPYTRAVLACGEFNTKKKGRGEEGKGGHTRHIHPCIQRVSSEILSNLSRIFRDKFPRRGRPSVKIDWIIYRLRGEIGTSELFYEAFTINGDGGNEGEARR